MNFVQLRCSHPYFKILMGYCLRSAKARDLDACRIYLSFLYGALKFYLYDFLWVDALPFLRCYYRFRDVIFDFALRKGKYEGGKKSFSQALLYFEWYE